MDDLDGLTGFLSVKDLNPCCPGAGFTVIMESTESRFAHLLQPIRELTKNWEIDVASELNDYLEELEDMCIMFDGGKTRLNFAEAALLIQGSTCIYSKKVELLHSLVYQTLEYINDKNKKKSKEAAASQEDNTGSMSNHHDSDEAEFTPVTINASTNSEKVHSVTSVSVIPLPPESLIPPETHEKHKLPLISLKGEIVCSQKDFRINLFVPGDNDMIILRSHRATPLDEDQPCPFLLFDQQQCGGPDVAAPVDASVGMADVGDAADDNFLPIDEGVEMDEPEEHVDRHQAPTEGRMIRERRQVDTVKLQTEREMPPAMNVWAMHDPYAVLEEDKPFKSGKCYKVPEGLDDGGKRKRKQPSLLPDFSSWFRGIFDPPEHKLKSGPTYTDLNYIYLNTLKDKVKTRKRIYKNAGVVVSDEELRQTFLQPQEADPQQQGEEPVDGFMGAEEDNSDNEQEDFPAEFGGGPDIVSPEAQKDEMTYEDLVKLRVEQLLVNSQGYAQETVLSRRVKQWQDKICPELALQEERPPFDIHDYSDRIVSQLNAVGQRRSFASLVSGMDNFEACKYLLATLQLANDYTVEIDSLVGLEESLDSMGLTLLSIHRATERFKTLEPLS